PSTSTPAIVAAVSIGASSARAALAASPAANRPAPVPASRSDFGDLMDAISLPSRAKGSALRGGVLSQLRISRNDNASGSQSQRGVGQRLAQPVAVRVR